MTASNPAFTPPYPPSWIDRFTGWVARLPGPDWLFYLGLWLVLFILHTAIHLIITALLIPIILFTLQYFIQRLLAP